MPALYRTGLGKKRPAANAASTPPRGGIKQALWNTHHLFGISIADTSVRPKFSPQPTGPTPRGRPTRKPPWTRPTTRSNQQWKATRSSEEQAWLKVLEDNLGSFYLPLYKWRKPAAASVHGTTSRTTQNCRACCSSGDSVSRGYTLAVRKATSPVRSTSTGAPENCGPTATA